LETVGLGKRTGYVKDKDYRKTYVYPMRNSVIVSTRCRLNSFLFRKLGDVSSAFC